MEKLAGARLVHEGHNSDLAVAGPPREKALLSLVERHVLPRLLLAEPAVVLRDRFGDGLSDRIPVLINYALQSDDARLQELLHVLHRRGLTFSQIQLGLLAPAARRLNELWQNDDATFVDVTIATGSLQRMMRFVALDLIPIGHPRQRHKTILIATAPGDTHGFGAAMAAEFYRRAGWTVQHEPAPTREVLVHDVAAGWIDVVGFSLTAAANADSLRETIRQVRPAALNPKLLVIAAGDALLRNPGLAGDLGVDATFSELPSAPARTHRLVRAAHDRGTG
jgi:MerR family transcriptional regulator, light-induced transcriptional regulator